VTKALDLRVDFDSDDWLRGDIWRPDGVLAGYVDLRIRGVQILRGMPAGMNNSAVALVRSGFRAHKAVADDAEALHAKWPLFFCSAALPNRCGVIRDFSVSHEGADVRLSDFFGCDIPRSSHFVVSRRTWTAAMLTLGTQVLRRCPPQKTGIRRSRMRQYLAYRARLAASLAQLRTSIRARGA
jgi:hypothetical protein